jgi:hypothetical protein
MPFWMQLPPKLPQSSSSGIWPETRWDRVLALRDPAAREEALREICELYRGVILARCRVWSEQDGEDLAQAFLYWLIQERRLEQADPVRGRFRSYLSTMLGNFLRKDYRAGQAQKRGGDAEHVDWVEESPWVDAASDAVFDRAWAQAVMGRVVMALRLEAEASGINEVVLRAVLPALLAEDEADGDTWKAVAARTGVASGTLRAQSTRLRQRFRELLEREVSICTTQGEVEAEIRHLVRALSVP